MKTILLTILMFPAFGLFAQTGQEKVSDTTEVMFGKKKIRINSDSATVNISYDKKSDTTHKKNHKVHTDFFAMDIGLNMLMYNGNPNPSVPYSPLETKIGASWNAGLHFFPTSFNIYKHKVNIKTALTLDVTDFGFRNSTTLVPKTTMVAWINDSLDFKKNKLKPLYLQVPLMLNFETHKKRSKSLHFSAGVYGGILIDSKTKQKSTERGKVVVKDDFNLNPFRYGVSARIGYGGISLYANYNLSPLFQSNLAPKVFPLSLGINIVPF